MYEKDQGDPFIELSVLPPSVYSVETEKPGNFTKLDTNISTAG